MARSGYAESHYSWYLERVLTIRALSVFYSIPATTWCRSKIFPILRNAQTEEESIPGVKPIIAYQHTLVTFQKGTPSKLLIKPKMYEVLYYALCTVYAFSLFLLTKILWGQFYYYPYPMDEKMTHREVQLLFQGHIINGNTGTQSERCQTAKSGLH